MVLTRQAMRSSTNCLLTALAVSDGLTMAIYLPYALHFYCLGSLEDRTTLGSAKFAMFYACFSVIVHTASIALTVTLAIFRYIYIKYAASRPLLCSMRRAKLAVTWVSVSAVIVGIPNILTLKIIDNRSHLASTNATMAGEDPEGLMYIVTLKKSSSSERAVFTLNFWLHGIAVKLIPCILVIVLSVLIIRSMRQADSRRWRLVRPSATSRSQIMTHESSTSSPLNPGPGSQNVTRNTKTRRTTYMLVTIMVLFVVTTLPHCLLLLLSGALPHFQEEIYHSLGDLIDIVALINNCVNFILYCAMSKQFRDTFKELFLERCCGRPHIGFQRVSTEPGHLQMNTV